MAMTDLKIYRNYLSVVLYSLLCTVFYSPPTLAVEDASVTYEFRCELNPRAENAPTTIARIFDADTNLEIESSPIPFIQWEASLGGVSAYDRCNIVSNKFQRLIGQGTAVAFISGYVNGQPSICAALRRGDSCRQETLLFTLRNSAQLYSISSQLNNIARGRVSYGLIEQGNSEIYFPLLDYLGDEGIQQEIRSPLLSI